MECKSNERRRTEGDGNEYAMFCCSQHQSSRNIQEAKLFLTFEASCDLTNKLLESQYCRQLNFTQTNTAFKRNSNTLTFYNIMFAESAQNSYFQLLLSTIRDCKISVNPDQKQPPFNTFYSFDPHESKVMPHFYKYAFEFLLTMFASISNQLLPALYILIKSVTIVQCRSLFASVFLHKLATFQSVALLPSSQFDLLRVAAS